MTYLLQKVLVIILTSTLIWLNRVNLLLGIHLLLSKNFILFLLNLLSESRNFFLLALKLRFHFLVIFCMFLKFQILRF